MTTQARKLELKAIPLKPVPSKLSTPFKALKEDVLALRKRFIDPAFKHVKEQNKDKKSARPKIDWKTWFDFDDMSAANWLTQHPKNFREFPRTFGDNCKEIKDLLKKVEQVEKSHSSIRHQNFKVFQSYFNEKA